MGSPSQRKRTLRRKNCSTKRFPPSTKYSVTVFPAAWHGLHVPCVHVEQHQARRSLVCGHTGDDSRGLDETEIECDRDCRFRTFERHPLVRILRTSPLDALVAPRLWRQMRALVNFPPRVRRFTGVRYRGCSFSTTSLWSSFTFCVNRRLRFSKMPMSLDFRSRISSFSRFSRRVHLSNFVPRLGNANSSKRRSSNFNSDWEDSRNGMSSSTTRLT